MHKQVEVPTRMSLTPDSIIGVVEITPDNIRPDNSYIIECPRMCRPLTVGWVNNSMIMWLLAPVANLNALRKQRLWVVPGGAPVSMDINAGAYVGTVLVKQEGLPEDDVYQDWHVFFDHSESPIPGDVQSTYSVH